MIKSILRYTAFSFRTITKTKVRIMLAIEWKRLTIGYRQFLACKDKIPDINQRITALYKAIEWLLRSQYYMKDYGFGSYKLGVEWSSSYPETTGYIIETLVKYSNLKKKTKLKTVAFVLLIGWSTFKSQLEVGRAKPLMTIKMKWFLTRVK